MPYITSQHLAGHRAIAILDQIEEEVELLVRESQTGSRPSRAA